MPSRRCLECHRLTNNSRRGLCRPCYQIPSIRSQFACLPSGRCLKKGGPWTVFEILKLIDMININASNKEISETIGKSINAVKNKKRRVIRKEVQPNHERVD